MRELNEKDKTTLEEDAAIYAKRDNRGLIERYRSLEGEEKRQYFKDYILPKLIGLAIGIACLVIFLVSIFKPKDEVLYHIAVLDNPFTEEASDLIKEKLNSELITGERQVVLFDTDYYVSTDGYASRTRIMTYIAAGEIDCMILSQDELLNYGMSDIYADLYTVLPTELLSSVRSELVYLPTHKKEGENLTLKDISTEASGIADDASCYAIDITGALSRLNGFDTNTPYYLVAVVNSEHTDSLVTLVRILFGS